MRHQCHKPKSVHVKETVKVAEICDAFDNLRYKVALTSYDTIDDGRYVLCYQIQVINCFSAPEPLIILDRPEDGEPLIFDYCYALKIYEECVRNYTSLVRAETRDFQDVEIYKEHVGYKKTQPECCATCRWCQRRKTPHQFIYGVSEKLECINPWNCKEIEDKLSPMHEMEMWQYEYINGHRCIPNDGYHDCSHDMPYPNVDPFGKCDHYLRNTRNQVPVPGQDITDFIDMRLGTRLDNRFKEVAKETLSTELTSELSVPVIQAVTMVLSGPDASVALSAPVVNIVTHSSEISSNTVAVIGTALSTNVLSAQMTTAVSSAISDPTISSAFETPVAAVMSTPAVQSATVNVIGTALSSNELSAQMVPAVSSVIPTSEVGEEVAKAAAARITIEKIIGNDSLKFTDNNNDGIPDEYQQDENTPVQTTLVWGGLGA